MIDILVVDDHAVVREGLRYLLTDGVEFAVVGEAASGQEALACLRERRVDIILLDLFMPDSDGLRTLYLIKQQAPEVPVLLFSGAPETEHALACLDAGAAGFASKDSDPAELRDAIRRVAAGGKYLGAKLTLQLIRGETTSRNPELQHLTEREQEVMRGIARGESLTALAESLGLSIKTISTHRRRLLDKLQLSGNAELVRYAMRRGLD